MSGNDHLKTKGAPSFDELERAGMLPSQADLAGRGCVCVECVEEIPCNPCETSCPQGALVVGFPITNLPVVDRSKCTLCGLCIPACPGLAIMIKSVEGEAAKIRFPWEYLPLPTPGEEAEMVDRLGETVCQGKILSVNSAARNNRTAVVTASFPAAFVQRVVSIRRKHGTV